MLGSVYGYTRCPDCGVSVPTAHIQSGTHVCDPDAILEHQVSQGRDQLERLETDIAEYLCTERAQKLLAFARWRRAHQR